jgi:hypothetical protein
MPPKRKVKNLTAPVSNRSAETKKKNADSEK